MTPRESRRLTKYGLTPYATACKLEAQDFACAICHIDFEEDEGGCTFNVDHNHNTGKVRGFLCHRCNILVGSLERNWDIITAAEDYIFQHNRRTRRNLEA